MCTCKSTTVITGSIFNETGIRIFFLGSTFLPLHLVSCLPHLHALQWYVAGYKLQATKSHRYLIISLAQNFMFLHLGWCQTPLGMLEHPTVWLAICSLPVSWKWFVRRSVSCLWAGQPCPLGYFPGSQAVKYRAIGSISRAHILIEPDDKPIPRLFPPSQTSCHCLPLQQSVI